MSSSSTFPHTSLSEVKWIKPQAKVWFTIHEPCYFQSEENCGKNRTVKTEGCQSSRDSNHHNWCSVWKTQTMAAMFSSQGQSQQQSKKTGWDNQQETMAELTIFNQKLARWTSWDIGNPEYNKLTHITDLGNPGYDKNTILKW